MFGGKRAAGGSPSGRRKRGPVIAGAVAILLLLPLAFVASPVDLPGPPIGEYLGLKPDYVATTCDFDEDRVRQPKGSSAPREPRWRDEPPIPGQGRPYAGAVSVGERIFILGGQGYDGHSPSSYSLTTVTAFDSTTGRYSRAPDMPQGVDHPFVATYDQDIYLVGGFSNGHQLGSMWRLDHSTQKWTRLPSMRRARAALAGGVIGDRLYVAGGAPPTARGTYAPNAYGDLEIFDIGREKWTKGPPLPTPRHHTASAVLDGKLYVIGGRTPSNLAMNTVERYDPRAGRWERLPSLPLGESAAPAVSVDGRIVVIAGGDDDGWRLSQGWVTRAVWAFDPQRASWSRLPDVQVPRHGHVAGVAGGRIYTFTGIPCPGFGLTPAVESLDTRAVTSASAEVRRSLALRLPSAAARADVRSRARRGSGSGRGASPAGGA